MLYIKLYKNFFIKLDKARDLSKLVKKVIIDKNGNKKTVYVKISKKININMRTKIQNLFNVYFSFGIIEKTDKIKDVNEKIINESKIFENNIIKLNMETCGSFDKNGKLIFSKSGNYDEIKFNENEFNKIKNMEIFTHNHPENKTFSMEDIFLLLSSGIKLMRVVSPNYIYSLQISSKNKSKNKRELFDKYNFIFDKIDTINIKTKKHFFTLIKYGKKTLHEASLEHNDKALIDFINDNDIKNILNIKYKREKNEK